jgi:hypothetical protein
MAVVNTVMNPRHLQHVDNFHSHVGEYGRRSSVDSIGNRLRAGRSEVRILLGARDFSFIQNVQTGSEPTHPPIQWVPAMFPGDKSAGAWSFSFACVSSWSFEWVEVYLRCRCMPLWYGNGKLCLLLGRILTSQQMFWCKGLPNVIQCSSVCFVCPL